MEDKKKGTFLSQIHDEEYDKKFDKRNFNYKTMIFTGGRKTGKLNGFWHYTMDQYDAGLRDSWQYPRGKNEAGQEHPWDYHTEQGELTTIPGCWNLINPRFFYFEGSVWYSRTFRYKPIQKNERVFLRIGGANYDTKVYLNTFFLGNHYGGSTPFFVEFTGYLTEENVIQVCVNNRRTTDRVPMRYTDWFNWGGLYRDIEILRVPVVFIKDLKLFLVPDNTYSHISVSITLSDETINDTVSLTIPGLGIKQNFPVKNGMCKVTITAKPDLWSPGNPVLYDVEVHYKNDMVADSVGFRQISVKGTDILLNGESLFLKGISVHEDDVLMGKSTNRKDITRRYNHAKELGCNFLRLAHYPHHEMVAKIADEMGFLLWEEIPVYWAINFENPSTYADAENQLMELINRDFNRASVIIWSVGNENADTDARLTFMGNLAKKAKSTDPSRLVSAACLVNHEKNKIEDRLTSYLDIIGLNEYYGWYNPNFEEFSELGENSDPDKPVLITEFGAGAKAGHHGTISEKFTEEFMEHLYKRQIDTIKKLGYVKGMTPWILYDFTCPRRQNKYQNGYNRKGLIAEDKKTKKLAFYVLRDFYMNQ